MKKSFKNKLGMYKTVKSVLDSSTSWNGLTAFESAYNAFGGKLTQLENFAYSQTLALAGVSSIKQAKRAEVATKALEMSGALMAYASSVGNVELRSVMKLSPSVFLYGAASKCLLYADLVIERASAHLPELGGFGIDQVKLDALIALRAEADVLFNAPRRAIVDRKTMTAKIDELVVEIDRILKEQLDTLMRTLDTQDHELVLNYRAARVIVDQPATHPGKAPGSGKQSDPGVYGV